MKKIKKLLYVVLAAVMVMPMTSCESYLNKAPSSDITEADVYGDFTSVSSNLCTDVLLTRISAVLGTTTPSQTKTWARASIRLTLAIIGMPAVICMEGPPIHRITPLVTAVFGNGHGMLSVRPTWLSKLLTRPKVKAFSMVQKKNTSC